MWLPVLTENSVFKKVRKWQKMRNKFKVTDITEKRSNATLSRYDDSATVDTLKSNHV